MQELLSFDKNQSNVMGMRMLSYKIWIYRSTSFIYSHDFFKIVFNFFRDENW